MANKTTKWTFELCKEEALKYNTRYEFQQKNGSAYKSALKNDWLDIICQHIKKGTTEYFIEKAKAIHGDKYDYSKTIYITNHGKVKIICKLHGHFEVRASSHLTGTSCKGCAVEKKKHTNNIKYGDKKANQIQEKTKKTNLERYDVEYVFQSKEFQDKSKKTMFERYGVKSPIQNKDIKNKIKKTNLERYGVEYATQNKEIYNKVKQTNIERYGFGNPTQNKEIQEKIKKTCLDRYGVENPFANKEIQEKIINSIKKKYKRNYLPKKHMLDKYHYLDDKSWLFEQYITFNKTAQQICVELKISNWTVCHYLHKHEIAVRASARFSMKCVQWLESIMEQEGIFIQHAGNIGEFNIPGTRYKADGYCQETNTVYEFHGDCFHGNPTIFESHEQCNPFNDLTASELYNKTIERENKIISLGYNLVVMWENDFNKL